MAQRISNIYRLVTSPAFYTGFANLLGADAARKRFVSEVITPRTGERVLDVGCGPASLLPFLPTVEYSGIDLNPHHIQFAREHYADRGRFFIGDATQLFALNDQFDLIIVSALLHHLNNAESKELLSNLCNLLRPGGRLVTFDCIWLPRQSPIAWTLNKLDSGLNIRTEDGYMALAEGLPVTLQCKTYRDLLRVPYDHFCMTLIRNQAA